MNSLESRLLEILERRISHINARSTLQLSVSRCHADLANLRPTDRAPLAEKIAMAGQLFLSSPGERDALLADLRVALEVTDEPKAAPRQETRIRVENEADVVIARSAGRDFSGELAFSATVQNKIATAISELARNIVQYAGRGEVVIRRIDNGRTGVEIRAVDQGPGIPHLDAVMAGNYRSRTGMGMGLRGTKRLMDEFEIDSKPGQGTTVTLRKYM
jgi:serine/threonine-protein kinase RsbT